MTEQPILYENAVEITGKDLRYAWENPAGEGVLGRPDLQVTAGTGLAVNVASGTGYVRGRTISDQGLYRIRCSATKASTAFEAGGIPTAHATLPRVDQIIAKLYDDDADASGQRKWRLEVLPGVATASANLDANRSPSAVDPLPADCIRLADVLVGAAATSLTAAEIRDRRRFIQRGTVPPILGAITAVGLEPVPPLIGDRVALSHALHDGKQAAVAMFLPRRQTALTRFRWRYAQGATALTGNYVLALYDSMGRLLGDTGSVAFAGAANTFKEEVRSFGNMELDGGVYWVLIGVDTGAGNAAFYGVHTALNPDAGDHQAGAPMQNLALRFATGGITPPTTLLGMVDVGASTTAGDSPPVPLVALSVGA